MLMFESARRGLLTRYDDMTAPDGDDADSIRARLTELEAERTNLIERLARLRGGGQALGDESTAAGAAITGRLVSYGAASREMVELVKEFG
jgi:hypothetical protein